MLVNKLFNTNGEKFMTYGLLEIEIMNVIWNIQEANEDSNISISDIVEKLHENNIKRAYTTVKTVMDRLVSKGVLARYKDGKKFCYRSSITRHEASKQAINNVSEQFFNGNYVQMLRFLEKECKALLV